MKKTYKNQDLVVTWNVKIFLKLLSDVMGKKNQSPVQKTRHNVMYKHAEKQEME